jgi:hypothetical protein
MAKALIVLVSEYFGGSMAKFNSAGPVTALKDSLLYF